MSEKGGDDRSSSRSISDQPFDDVESVGGAVDIKWQTLPLVFSLPLSRI